MKEYDHKKIEKKWRGVWDKKKAYKSENKSKKKKYYVLDMFPYPSGVGLHVGHPKGYIGSDVFARLKRMQGYNVLHPMGYDAFGLPAEQYAIEHNINPRQAVEKNVKTFEEQLSIIGLSYDWSRRVNTTDPEFYKWTQWIFLKIYNSWYNKNTDKAEPIEKLIKIFAASGNARVSAACDKDCEIFSAKEWKAKSPKEKQDTLMKYRLAYEGYAEVNWCPQMGTVLANDEVVDGPNGPVSERGGYPVERRSMRQWFMRITAYADRLLAGLDELNWSSHIKEIQKNWIGRSEGAEIDFKVAGEFVKIFTTRADTLYGATYLVLSPEHPVLQKIKNQISNWGEAQMYILATKAKAEADRTDQNKEKTGVELKGIKAINPATNEELPVWIADYVLAGYGTGAIMAVPAHDERDFEFAQKYNLPIKQVVNEDGKLFNSGRFDDLDSEIAKRRITDFVGGSVKVNFKMRDAIFARQRYWGEPIPLIHEKDGMIEELPEKKLPLKLPPVKSYQPTGTGESPLASVASWVKAGYETNTMPGWAGSSWYFLRYMDPKNIKSFADKSAIKYWRDVDMYVGGQEHATGHLLYSRFWHKVLKDYGLVVTEEPFKTLRNQGMILGTDNRKMSKRWGNVINPNDVVATHGADTLRVYEMFMGPFEASLPWSTDNIVGSRRFLERVWKLSQKFASQPKNLRGPRVSGSLSQPDSENSSSTALSVLLHKTIKKVTEDIENFSFNTCISAMMILLNEMEKNESLSREDFELFIKILNPFAPHITEEVWSNFGHKTLLVLEAWPEADESKMKESEMKIVLQVNGKVRATMMISTGLSEPEVKDLALKNEAVVKFLAGQEVKRIIYIEGRLVNIVA